MTVPYENATSGVKAREEISTILRRFGCERIGFMEDFEHQSVLVHFVHRGRTIEMTASAAGWAKMFLKDQPYRPTMRRSHKQYVQAALDQGMIAVNSILRDCLKGQITAIEAGIFDIETVFLPFMIMADGRRLADHAQELLPAIEDRSSK